MGVLTEDTRANMELLKNRVKRPVGLSGCYDDPGIMAELIRRPGCLRRNDLAGARPRRSFHRIGVAAERCCRFSDHRRPPDSVRPRAKEPDIRLINEPLAKLQWCDEFSTGMSGKRGVRGVLG